MPRVADPAVVLKGPVEAAASDRRITTASSSPEGARTRSRPIEARASLIGNFGVTYRRGPGQRLAAAGCFAGASFDVATVETVVPDDCS